MRRVIFRGKSQSGKWIYGYYLANEQAIVHQDSGIKFYVDPETVGMFTGLQDRNGADIYEGDVVATRFCSLDDEYRYEVSYDEDRASFVFLSQSSTFGGYLYATDFAEMEVVGNIYE